MSGEKVLGGLEVAARLGVGTEHLFALFTDKRMILAHVAKVGAKALALSSILGRLSSGFGRVREKAGLLEKMVALPTETILGLDAANFAISYEDVVSLIVEPEDWSHSVLTIVTHDRKIQLSASTRAAAGLRELIETLMPNKARFRD